VSDAPSYLVRLLRDHIYNLSRMTGSKMKSKVLSSMDIASVDPIPVTYQGGHLMLCRQSGNCERR